MVNASLCLLYNGVGVYLVQVSLLLVGQQGLGQFFWYRPFLPICWRIVQILIFCQCQRKTTNAVPTTLSAMQAASQSSLINGQSYTTCE
jgi:hypothetical protein